MIVAADWVLPVEAPPIRRGAVLVRGRRIALVGPLDAVVKSCPGERVVDFPGCVCTPGLVNAHSHLSLTALGGLLEPSPFAEWLPQVPRAVRALDPDDLAASSETGALECLRHGVTAVGDVAYGPEAMASAGDVGVGGVFFWEVLGISAGELAEELAEHEFPVGAAFGHRARTRPGLSPHSPYTSGPGLLEAVAAAARKGDIPFAVHVAESQAEVRLTVLGGGPLADVAGRLALGFRPRRMGPVAYLDALGVLRDAVAVHCVHLLPGDTARLAERTRGVVLCPRSNRFLDNGDPPVAELMQAGCTLALGTDSSASNTDLDLRAEARVLREIAPAVTGRGLLRMLTADAAAMLGVADAFGAVAPGRQADLALFRCDRTTDPEEAVIDERCRVEAVLSAGSWRVREGRALFEPAAEAATKNARAKAARALGVSPD